MEKYWEAILEFWQTNPVVDVDKVGAPATEADLKLASKLVGQPLPQSFCQFYAIHNGWDDLVMPQASVLLPLATMPAANQQLRRQVQNTPLFQQLPAVFIPFTRSSRHRDFFCIDLISPNNTNCVFFVSTDVQEFEYCAESFEQWIVEYIQTLHGSRASF